MLTDPHSGYPGYEDAVARLRMPFEYTEPYVVYGTQYMYLLRVDQPAPGEFHAVLCSWQHGLAIEKGDRYVGPGPVVPVFASTVDLRAPADAGSERTSAGEGPARYPSNNVFGAWVVVAADLVADDFADTELCRSLPDNPVPPELLANPDGRYAQPLPSLPPFPGWPARAGG